MSSKRKKKKQLYLSPRTATALRVCLQANKHTTTQTREISWLLDSLQETLVSLKAGLEECYALLAPIEPGSTLVLSSPRSECIKGHVTRIGTRVVKGVCSLPHSLLLPPIFSFCALRIELNGADI
jgi:hypothetical protein